MKDLDLERMIATVKAIPRHYSEYQRIQSGDGVALYQAGIGVIQQVSKSNPVNGTMGYAPGCEWYNTSGTGNTYNTGILWINVGSNGLPTGPTTTNPASIWIQVDSTYKSSLQFGGNAALMFGAGTIYRTILTTTAGLSPSATGLLKIVDAFTLPASTLNTAGQGLNIVVYATVNFTAANTVQLAMFANVTNTQVTTTNSALGAYGSTNFNQAGVTDGTITATGTTTTIFNTGALTTTNLGSGVGNFIVDAMFAKTVTANTQIVTTTGVVGPTGHAGATGGAWANLTLTESSAITFVICASASSATTNIVYQGCQIQGFN